ncbi:MAG: PQQ-like beta-propeller repeat protein [Phycisphaerae bacterium]|jgi:outer membrane protein assembly factor BamB|nr:PQQ-like beta-propeller repeat protein [Phycisphaerae bacterium]MCZ2398984.1 PQQ-like beta-propeller repeat protein [Phycisphaerae bacterium]NUQ48563.1 PQQ-like beta-propeller repeat protein [Phycisphaerae bacterium]
MLMPLRLAALLATAILVSASAAEDWPNFLGPRHDGLSRESGLKTNWSTAPPKRWERQIGSAFSGISCVGDRVYTCGTVDRKQTLICLNADTGELIWQRPFEAEYVESQGGNGTRATPTIADNRVYVLGALGAAVCFDAADGREIWRREFEKPPTWGFSGSVLIEGDLAVLNVNGLTALNRKTGESVWTAGSGPAGYSTPYPFTFEGKRYICGFMGRDAIVVEAASGRQVLSVPWKTDWNVNAAAPIYHDGHLFLSSGYRTGSALFELKAAGDKLEAREVWRNNKMMNKFQSSLLIGGHLYASDQNGLRCINFRTGEPAWIERRVSGSDLTAKDGTMAAAEGYLYYLSEQGQLLIARATPEGFSPQTNVSVLNGLCWTLPTIYRGRLYVRNLDRIACYSLTE